MSDSIITLLMSVEFLSFYFLLAFLGGRGWALIRGWELINFFHFLDGRLFEVGAKWNKYGTKFFKK